GGPEPAEGPPLDLVVERRQAVSGGTGRAERDRKTRTGKQQRRALEQIPAVDLDHARAFRCVVDRTTSSGGCSSSSPPSAPASESINRLSALSPSSAMRT